MDHDRVDERVGLCADCQHVRPLASMRKVTYYLCGYSRVDPSFPKYPTLPVTSCAAYAPILHDDPTKAR